MEAVWVFYVVISCVIMEKSQRLKGLMATKPSGSEMEGTRKTNELFQSTRSEK